MPTRIARASVASFAYQPKAGVEFIVTARDRLRVDSSEAETFLRFANPVPSTEQVVSAYLEVTAEEDWTGSRTLTARRMNAPDSYAGLNWTNRPSVYTGSIAVPVTQAGTVRLWQFPVTTDVATGASRFDFRIVSSDTTSRWLKGGRVNKGFPRLVVETELIPEAPSDITPDGIISVAAPVVQWTAQEDMDKAQVQVGTVDVNGDWDTTTFPTGDVVTDVGMVDLAGAGWTGIADGATTHYRVRQHLPAGWSAWSDPVEITRVIKPTATITNPGATVADPTPPITWTSAGQEAWRVIVERGGSVVADSTKRSGTATTWTPPRGARRVGGSITVTLRTWDGEDRSPSSGDPAYSEDVQVTTFVPTDTVAPVSTISVVQHGKSSPGLEVGFTRTVGLPDEIIVYRASGDSEVPGDEVHRQDGGDPPWIDWTAPPNAESTYSIAAVVNGETAEGIKSLTVWPTVQGVWLVDPDTGRGFALEVFTYTEAVYGEVSAVHTAYQAARQIRRTSALLGAENTFRGRISARDDRPVSEQVADLWWMRGQPHKVWRLIAGDLNIPVTVNNLYAVVDPDSRADELDMIGNFSFTQDGELPFEAL